MDNRELATFILLASGVLYALTMRAGRSSMLDVARHIFFSRLTLPLSLLAASVVAAIFLARSIEGLWSDQLTAAAILWFLFVGFEWFIHLGDAGKDPGFFKKRILAAVGIGALFEFFLNIYTLPLLGELIVQVSIVSLIAVNVFAAYDEKHRPTSRIAAYLIGLIVVLLAIFTAVQLATSWNQIDQAELARELLLPIWLTLAVLPSLYLTALYAEYEALLIPFKYLGDRKRPSLSVMVGLVGGLRGSLVDIRQFRGVSLQKAAEATSAREVFGIVKQFKKKRVEDRKSRAVARQRLIENAGVIGVDTEGRVLDRREFEETKKALRWVATCHMGWYRRDDQPNEYRDDLLEMLRSGGLNELPSNPDIVMKVRSDKQAWFAYRLTPSGHVFGIGAAGGPPSQWFYDGNQPPDGYPKQGATGWSSFMEPDRLEWRGEPST